MTVAVSIYDVSVLSSMGISSADMPFIFIGVLFYGFSIALLLLHMQFEMSPIRQYLSKEGKLGKGIRGWLKVRSAIKDKVGFVVVFPLSLPKAREKIVRQSVVDALLLVFLIYVSVFLYEAFLSQIDGDFYASIGFSRIRHGDLLKALGSLTLAFEAVYTGANEFTSRPTKLGTLQEQQYLGQKARQYTYRFCGAIALAVGYGYIVVLRSYELFVQVFSISPPVSLLLGLLALIAIGVEYSVIITLIIGSVLSLFFSFLMFYAASPILLIPLVILWSLIYYLGLKWGYSGVFNLEGPSTI